MDRPSVLFVVAHRTLERRLRPGLEERYDVAVAQVRRKALQIIEDAPPNLVLLDVPSVRFDVGRFFEFLADFPAQMVSFLLLGKGMRLDQMPRVNGYLRHPITQRQLMHRLSRVVPDRPSETVEWQGLYLDIQNRLLIWQGQQIPLTPKQAALALVFFRAPCTMVPREQLMRDIWGTDYMGDTRTLDVHIHWFRKALRQSQAPFQLETVRGTGYRMVHLSDNP